MNVAIAKDSLGFSVRDQLMQYAVDLSRVYRNQRTRETELKRLRSLVDSILETTTDAVLLLDSSLRVLDANSAFCGIVGIQRATILGANVQSTAQLGELRRWLGAGTLAEDRTASFQLDLTEPPTQLEAHVSPVRQGNDVLGWIWIFRERGKGSRLSASEVMATLSHQIRSPLTSVVGYADLLNEHLASGDHDTDESDIVRALLEAASGLREVLEEVLTYESIGERSPCEWVDLGEIAKRVEVALSHEAEDAGIKVNVHVPEAASLTVRGDPRLAEMAIRQVVRNAVNFSPEGSAVNVLLLSGTEGVEISVHDSGPGIPQTEIGRVFEPFYRVENVESESGTSGLGLGLALARRIVEWHGGSIWAESDPAGGSTFTLKFPYSYSGSVSR